MNRKEAKEALRAEMQKIGDRIVVNYINEGTIPRWVGRDVVLDIALEIANALEPAIFNSMDCDQCQYCDEHMTWPTGVIAKEMAGVRVGTRNDNSNGRDIFVGCVLYVKTDE